MLASKALSFLTFLTSMCMSVLAMRTLGNHGTQQTSLMNYFVLPYIWVLKVMLMLYNYEKVKHITISYNMTH